ncbi:unnamed protein product [Bursaphelenchus xylophilus]|uniref:(pine wood nematode) hypothetical protein n=1 Tax=Bursaphelenchus xylophilus TaxID=6326 RepID=A0A7I8WH53_BURXY|nr:unnamed protein product [Bursaphelenchus xylophilus]CAG9110154.1 unnamed protein product [Bursaphelenchus xylophilus]
MILRFLWVLLPLLAWAKDKDHSIQKFKERERLLTADSDLISLTAYEDVLATLNSSTIVVYRIAENATEYELERICSFRLDDTIPFAHVFRLDSERSLVLCGGEFCFLFGLDYTIKRIELRREFKFSDLSAGAISSVRATADEKTLVVQVIEQSGLKNSTIVSIDIAIGTVIGRTDDHKFNRNEASVLAFNKNGFSYFLNTATRLDNPRLLVEKSRYTHQISNIKLTRVCNKDTTYNLESKIDISLGCTMDKSHYTFATAASVSNDQKTLLVAAKDLNESSAIVCRFDLAQVLAYFDTTWEICQHMTNPKEIQNQCISGTIDRPEKCHTFSWLLKKQVPICQRFNMGSEILDNCNLNASTSNAYRAGWVENYLPIEGKVVAVFKIEDNADVIEVLDGGFNDTLYVQTSDNDIQRVRSWENHNELLWKRRSDKMVSGRVRNKDVYYYTFKDHRVNYVTNRCTSLYPDCNSINWNDSLNCGYCAFSNSTGKVTSTLFADKCKKNNGQFCHNFCPPIIKTVSFGGQTVSVIGENMMAFKEIDVKVCERKCAVSIWSKELVSCKTDRTTYNTCPVEISGHLSEINQMFMLTHLRAADHEEDEAQRRSKRWLRFVAAAVAIVTAIALLLCAAWFMKCYQRKQKKRKMLLTKRHILPDKHDDCRALDGSVDANGVPIINQNTVRLIEMIGSGNSATVHLGILNRGGKQLNVAVKKIKYFETGELEKAMREVRLISECKHPNIVECIGYYSCVEGYLNVVMEYVKGGDLHTYLINKEKSLVARTAFSYIEQLVKGMQYMATQKIIHRDLAARNCILSDDYTKLKITDFGLCRRANNQDEYIPMDQFVKLPFRWTAVECLTGEYAFSEKSDVWSFGVVCWEIFSRESMPYKELVSSDEVYRYLIAGHRLAYPASSCPKELYEDIMYQCWAADSTHRPTFDELAVNLHKLLKRLDDIYQPTLDNDGYEKPLSVAHRSTVQTISDSESDPEPTSSSSTPNQDVGYVGLNTMITNHKDFRNIYTDHPVSDYNPAIPNGYSQSHSTAI